jgi:hypothetical protein
LLAPNDRTVLLKRRHRDDSHFHHRLTIQLEVQLGSFACDAANQDQAHCLFHG